MPKYTINIADTDIAVNTSESPETVDQLVGLIDRRIRDIVAKSPRCTKSEAAILCALDYCADKVKNEARSREMEHDFVRISKELEALKADFKTLSEEAEELRRSNRVMRDIMSRATVNTAGALDSQIANAETPALPAEEPAEAAEADKKEAAPIALAAPAENVPEEGTQLQIPDDFDMDANDILIPKRPRRGTGKNTKSKVGDMFDMLTFRDI